MHPFRQGIWGHIWKRTVEKRQTNATNVTMPQLRQAIWGHIWKHTVGKNQTNATNVIMHPLRKAIWGLIWKHTVEKRQTLATSLTLHPPEQAIWGLKDDSYLLRMGLWGKPVHELSECEICIYLQIQMWISMSNLDVAWINKDNLWWVTLIYSSGLGGRDSTKSP